MHPDSPIRQLDEIIRRYGVTCLELVPFEGGGYCVRIGSAVEPVTVGADSLPEAIGKAFIELMKRQGRPSVDQLIEMSSLGTPQAKRLRAQADPAQVKKILEKVDRHTYENPAVHLKHGESSACGLVRTGGTHARFTTTLEDVTCGRCKHSSWYRSELTLQRRRRS